MDSGKRDIVIKAAALAFLAALIAAAETSLFPFIRIFGGVPRLLFFLTAAAAVYEGPMFGLFIGALSGFLMDGTGGQSGIYYTLFLLVAGAVVGAVSPSLFRKRPVTAAGWGAGLLLAAELSRFFFAYYLFGRAELFAVWQVIFPELFYSLLFSFVPVWPVALLNARLKRDPGLFR